MEVNIENGWKEVLSEEFSKEYFIELTNRVKYEYSTKKIYPAAGNIFNAFNNCPYRSTKVIIIGQDPYHGINQANGLSFSVNKGINIPPSLQNIYKEIESDLGIKVNKNDGDLTRWAKQGVLLLNSTLTVRANTPNSHKDIGWEIFTDSVIDILSEKKNNLVFILWGKYAQKKGERIDRNKHLVLVSPHPSPYSANTGFFGCRHFSICNNYLKTNNIIEIDWS